MNSQCYQECQRFEKISGFSVTYLQEKISARPESNTWLLGNVQGEFRKIYLLI